MNGASPPELVAAVSEAGGLGSLAGSLLSPMKLRESVDRLRTRTSAPFAVNLFILSPPDVSAEDAQLAAQRLRPFLEDLGMPPQDVPFSFGQTFAEQLDCLKSLAPPIASFTFAILDASDIRELKAGGTKVIGTATTSAEVQAWDRAGADAVCLQGTEAGGHRATFLGDIERSCVGLMALIPQARRATDLPLIAAGGIMNGSGIAAALALGADAVQLGSAFMYTPESGISETWRYELSVSRDDSTRLTQSFSGRHARGIENAFMREMQHERVPPYPVQNALTSPMRQRAAELGRSDLMSLWAGQAAGLGRHLPAAELIQLLMEETQTSIALLSDRLAR